VQQGEMFGFKVRPQPPVDVYYDLSPVFFGDYEVRIHHTPGHCPGGVCLQMGRKGESGRELFVGDTLFAGAIGRTDLPGGDYSVLLRSIIDVIFPLGDDCVVHPGHGPDTTIARERTSNPFVLEYVATKATKS
jgi:glyoxylase-like metal-dependent hydrolase (beta-lactamase superfamily II)